MRFKMALKSVVFPEPFFHQDASCVVLFFVVYSSPRCRKSIKFSYFHSIRFDGQFFVGSDMSHCEFLYILLDFIFFLSDSAFYAMIYKKTEVSRCVYCSHFWKKYTISAYGEGSLRLAGQGFLRDL